MSGIGFKAFQMMANMSHDERMAYSMGLSNAYQDVFNHFAEAFTHGNADVHAIFMRITSDWDDVRNQQIIKGVL